LKKVEDLQFGNILQMGVDRHGTGVVECIRATDFPSGKPYGAVAFLVGIHRESIFSLFYLSRSFIPRGGDRRKTSLPTRFLSYAIYDVRQNSAELYMTWEVFFLFCTVVIDLLALVVLIYQNNKKK
jgi:hypothetical protein